jgi:hypothetical protein
MKNYIFIIISTLLYLSFSTEIYAQTNRDSITNEEIILREVEILSQKEAGRLQDIPASVSVF